MEFIKKSYEVAFILLVCVSIITSLRSLRVNNELDQLKLQLSTMITSIASFHYYLMLNRIENVVAYRYLDWFFTTPLLLIDLCITVGITDKKLITELIAYNTAMIGTGFLGEIQMISRMNGTIFGFIPLYFIFKKIYDNMEKTKENITLFKFFTGLWITYGVVYIAPQEEIRNVSYNVLDVFSKGAFGMYLYYDSYKN
jgi:bacteriorhodopsin